MSRLRLAEIQVGDVVCVPTETDNIGFFILDMRRQEPGEVNFKTIETWHPETTKIEIWVSIEDTVKHPQQTLYEVLVFDLKDNIKKKCVLGDFKTYFTIPGDERTH